MRLPIFLMTLLLAGPVSAGGLHAQTTPSVASAAPAAVAPPATAPQIVAPAPEPHPVRKRITRKRVTPAERFAAANTAHDGHLTLEQAKAARLYAVSRHFDAIDTGHKGYVTTSDILAYARAQRVARLATKRAAACKS
jgi:hypothetical protein